MHQGEIWFAAAYYCYLDPRFYGQFGVYFSQTTKQLVAG